MKTHDRERLDDRTLDGGKLSAKTPKPRPAYVEQSILDLQATVGNRAVGDLMAGSGPVLQGSVFGGPFGGLEEWLGEESPEGSSSLDASSKAEVADASMKEAPSDNSMKVADGSDKWDASEKVDASDKWDASEKLDSSDKWDASAKSELGLASKADELGSELEFEEY